MVKKEKKDFVDDKSTEWPKSEHVMMVTAQKLMYEIIRKLERVERPIGGISIFLLYYLLLHIFPIKRARSIIKNHPGYAALFEELGLDAATLMDSDALIEKIEDIIFDDLSGSEEVTHIAINNILKAISVLWGDLFTFLWGSDETPGIFHQIVISEIQQVSRTYDILYRVLAVYQWIFSKKWKYFFPEDIIYSQDELFGILRGRLDERTDLDDSDSLSLYTILATEPETFKKIIVHKIREKIINTIQKPIEEILVGLEDAIMHSYESIIFQLQDLEAKFPPSSPIIKNLIKDIRKLHKNPNKINTVVIKNLKERVTSQIREFLKEAEHEFTKVEKEFFKQLKGKPPYFQYLQFDEQSYTWKVASPEKILKSLSKAMSLHQYLDVDEEPRRKSLLKRLLPIGKPKKGLYQQIIEMFYPYNLKFIHSSYLAATVLEKNVFDLFELLSPSKLNTEEHLTLITYLMKLKMDTGNEDLHVWLLEANRDVIENLFMDSIEFLKKAFFKESPPLYHAEGTRRTSYIPLVEFDAQWFNKTNPSELFPKDHIHVFYDEHRHIFQIGMIPVNIERAIGSNLYEALLNHVARMLGKYYWKPVINLLEPFLTALAPQAMINLETCPIPYKIVDSFWTGI